MALIRLIVIALVLLALITLGAAMLLSANRQTARAREFGALNREIHDLAFDHLDVSPELANAVLSRIALVGGHPEGRPASQIPADVLRLCIEHRETDPAFSTILADTIRSRGYRLGPRELD